MVAGDSMPLLSGYRVHPESHFDQCDLETTRRIVSFLDAVSLSRTTRVNSRFHNVCEEPHLWRRLAERDFVLQPDQNPRLIYQIHHQERSVKQRNHWLREWSAMCISITVAMALIMSFVLSIMVAVWLDSDTDINVNVLFIPLWIFSLATLLGLDSCRTSIRRIQYKPFTPSQERRILVSMGVLCFLVPFSVLWLQLRLTVISINWHLVFLPLYILFVLGMLFLVWVMVVTEGERENYLWVFFVFLLQLTLFLLGIKLQNQSLSLTQVFIPLYILLVATLPFVFQFARTVWNEFAVISVFACAVWGCVLTTFILFAGYFDSRLVGEISYAFIPYWVSMALPTFWSCFLAGWIWTVKSSREYDD